MRAFGLLGFPLGHSFSVPYFKNKFEREGILNCRYEAYPIDSINRLKGLLSSHKDLEGLNVTIPYKEAVIPYLDQMDGTAKEIGAVNTIRIRNGILKGYNTDIIGFENSLLPILQKPAYKALILGTGGASKAVAYVLKKQGIPYRFVSRNPENEGLAYDQIQSEIMNEYHLLINCTPLGMSPHLESFPEIPYSFIGANHILYDLIYNPEETLFLKKGKEQGARIKNGLEMLHLQAEASWEIWNNNV